MQTYQIYEVINTQHTKLQKSQNMQTYKIYEVIDTQHTKTTK